MRPAIVTAVVVALVLATHAAAASARPPSKPTKVTFVGDSIAASILYVPAARARLRAGLSVRLDLAVCRRLVELSCPYRGSRPTTALEAVRARGKALGDVLVVDVGYNDPSQGYGDGIDTVMRAAVAQGAEGVVWVTLRETTPNYAQTNDAIRAAARRWPQLVVADWNAFGRGKTWFRPDGLHLGNAGATALAGFVRAAVGRAAPADT